MTPRQKYLYDFIKSYIKKHGYAPDYIDMMQYMQLKSKSVIHHHLKQLESAGKIKINLGKCRGIEIMSTQKKQLEILTKKLKYAERTLRVISATTADDGTAKYAHDMLINLDRMK